MRERTMLMRTSAAGLVAAFLINSHLQAQNQLTQTVQLPTFSSFSVSTTVSVPVSGRGYLGGVQRRRAGSVSHGLPWLSSLPGASRLARSRALSLESSSAGATVTATVADLKKLDLAVLSEAAARRGTPRRDPSAADRKAVQLTRHVSNTTSAAALTLGPSVQSVAEIRRQNAVADSQRAAVMMTYWKRARAAEAAGRTGAARCGYQLVARRGKGKFREAALARLDALSAQPQVAKAE